LSETKPREFEPVPKAESLRLLKEGAKHTAAAFIWTSNQELSFHSHLTVVSETDAVFYVWVPKEMDANRFVDDMAAKGLKECSFSVSLLSANIFFKARLNSVDAGGIRFRFPEQIFKVQRRHDLRFPIPDGHILKVEFPDPVLDNRLLTQKVLDISAGGVGILVSDELLPNFQVGLVLKGLSFALRGRTIVCDAEIRHVKKIPPGGRHAGHKIGLRFIKLTAADEQHVASYVFDESRKYYSHLLG
jgi:hypothetical protein